MSADRTKLTPAAGGVAYNPGALFHMPNQGDYGQRQGEYHVGIDYAAKAGTPIPAASSGEVVYSGPSRGFHHAVVVKSAGQDGKVYYSIYGHVDPQNAIAPGTKVSAGDTIGAIGTPHPDEGERSDGPHEHFGIVTQDAIDAYNRKNGTRISVAPNGGESGGIGFRTGQTQLFVNPDEFTNYADGAPYNARTYVPIRDGLAPRPVPYLAQSQEADRLGSNGASFDPAAVLPDEVNRFYTDIRGPATDAADNSPVRFLARRTYDLSQGSAFTAQPVPSQPSADGSLSINDAYLEYLRRLNAN